MNLHRIANKYNNLEVSDAYGTATFMAQFEPMSFTKIDGVSVRKRQISVDPAVVVPARGVVRINGEEYLIGTGAPDFWRGTEIRKTYVIQGADGLASICSIADKLAANSPTQAYAALAFNKYMPEANDNSKYPPQYQIFTAGSEQMPEDTIVTLAGEHFLVKQSYLSTSGLRIALANELSEPVFETATVGAKTYDPVTDTYGGSNTTAPILRVKWSEHFSYLTKASTTHERGDIQCIGLKAAFASIKPSDTIGLSDGTWRVLAVQDEGATMNMHLRRA